MKGTKRKRSEGVWELRVYVGRDPVTGKPRQISKTFHGGSRGADNELRSLIEAQAPSRSDGLGVSVGQLFDKWLEECSRLDLSPTTIGTYRSQLNCNVVPTLGKLSLTKLSAKHLDNLYGTMKAKGLSPKTIRNHHAIISSALHQSVRWGWTRTNVAQLAKPPKISQRRVEAPSVEIVRSVIESGVERDPRLAPLLILAALTGMRRGELCALRWSDIDLDLCQIEVSRSLVIVPGGVSEKTTKTGRSRKVAIDPVGIALLSQHKALCRTTARDVEVTLASDAFVFSPEIDSLSPFRPDAVTNFFIRVRDAVGAKSLRLHDLRTCRVIASFHSQPWVSTI